MVPLKSWAGVALVVVVTFGLTVLGAVLASGTVLAPAIAVIGWLIVAPVLAILTYCEDEEPESTTAESAPLSTLRERYARGELSDEEFERRTERLIETEDEPERAGTRRERERVRER